MLQYWMGTLILNASFEYQRNNRLTETSLPRLNATSGKTSANWNSLVLAI